MDSLLRFLLFCLFVSLQLLPAECNWLTCGYSSDSINSLRELLSEELIGQEYAVEAAMQLFSAHLDRVNLQSSSNSLASVGNYKPLVISMHGMTGTGKTLMSQLISRSFYPSPSASVAHILRFHGMQFNSQHNTEEQLDYLKKSIAKAIQSCAQTIVIFEELHYMHPEILNKLLYFFDYGANIENSDGTQAIYIFTSNIAGQTIQKLAWEAAQQNIARINIPHALVEQKIKQSLRQQNQLNLLLNHAIVDSFVPFFPLFKSHVKQCFKLQLEQNSAQMARQNQVKSLQFAGEILEFAASKLSYIGPVSRDGCKPVKDVIIRQILAPLTRQLRLDSVPILKGIWHKKLWNFAEFHAVFSLEKREANEKLGGLLSAESGEYVAVKLERQLHNNHTKFYRADHRSSDRPMINEQKEL
jgi:ATP-dependent Clp protease ATP-binding subunit ClpA